jgi:hypothetical protein
VRSARNTDGGSVTAEFAIVVPAVIAVLALVLGGISMGRDALAVSTAAHQAARAIARGDDPAQVQRVVFERVPGATVDIVPMSGEVCVTVQASIASGARAWFEPPTARACAPRDL